jgi:hypothetical protein
MSTVVPVTLPSDMWYMTVSDTSMCSDLVTVKIAYSSTCLKREKWGQICLYYDASKLKKRGSEGSLKTKLKASCTDIRN